MMYRRLFILIYQLAHRSSWRRFDELRFHFIRQGDYTAAHMLLQSRQQNVIDLSTVILKCVRTPNPRGNC